MTDTISKPMPPAPGTIGAFPGIDIEDYHADKEAVSKSALDDFNHSPFIYWANRFAEDRPAPGEDETAARLAGNMLHCALLEPEHFGKRYAVVPDDAPKKPSITQRNAAKPSADTVVAIDWWDRFLSDNANKKIVKPEKYDVAFRQADSLRKIKEVRDLLDAPGAQAEVSEYFIDPVTQLYCKIRPDLKVPFGAAGDMLADAKTARSARGSEFARAVATMRYHVQDGFYSEGHTLATGRPTLGFLFMVVESEWPFYSNAIMLDDASKNEGRATYRKDLNGIAQRKQSGIWNNHDSGVEVVSLPGYAFTAPAAPEGDAK